LEKAEDPASVLALNAGLATALCCIRIKSSWLTEPPRIAPLLVWVSGASAAVFASWAPMQAADTAEYTALGAMIALAAKEGRA
jgi:hypothetical protein